MAGVRTTVSCFDRLFDKDATNQYYLSIRLEPDGLFFSVYDPVSQKYIGFESALLAGIPEIYDHIAKHELLRLSFAKTICIVPAKKYTIVPSALFVPEKAQEYFQFVHTLETSEELRHFLLLTEEASLLYASNMAWFEIINDHFSNAVSIPLTAAFADFILPRVRNSRAPVMYINLYNDNFDLILVEDGKLKFCNNFTYKGAEDIAYYTVFVVDQLKVNTDKTELKLSGRINSKPDVIKLLKRYIKSVDILDIEREVKLSYALSEINSYSYPDLFNPRLCEL